MKNLLKRIRDLNLKCPLKKLKIKSNLKTKKNYIKARLNRAGELEERADFRSRASAN